MTKPTIAAAMVLLVACGTPAPTQTAPPLTGTLDQLLAPIALYPDQLLAQMLMSATDPSKVTELDKWLKSNAKLKGTQLQDAAVKAGFDASFVALVLFPQVVSRTWPSKSRGRGSWGRRSNQIEARYLPASKN